MMLRKFNNRVRALTALGSLGVATYLYLVSRAKPMLDHPFNARDGVLVFAHKGGDGLRPGNTISAYQHAVELGVDVLDIDIHMSKDGVIVAMHDDTVDGTTNGTGLVQNMTFEEIKRLDAGYRWNRENPDETPFRGQGVTVPSLEEILQAFPNLRFNIDVKQETPSLVPALCDLIHRYGMEDQFMVNSFHESTIREFRAVCPDVATGGYPNEMRVFYFMSQLGLARAYKPEAYSFQVPEYSESGLHVVTPKFVADAAALNIPVYPWTINDEATMRRMIDEGVPGINTDYPDVLLRVLGRLS